MKTNTEDIEILASIGRRWHHDSRLETWFPITAEELAKLQAENTKLREALRGALNLIEARVRGVQPHDWLEILARARQALAPSEGKAMR
jgi:hypothetical protein